MSEKGHAGGPPQSIKDQEAEKSHPAKHEPDKSVKPANVIEHCADLSVRLDAAVAAQDVETITALWKEMDSIYKAKHYAGTEKLEVSALSCKFHHLAPREVS